MNSTNVDELSSDVKDDNQVNYTQGKKPLVTANDRHKKDCYHDPRSHKGCNYKHKEGQQRDLTDANKSRNFK